MNRLGRGQSLTDRVMAAKHSLTGRGLAKAVHKASTEELLGPKLKHLEYLVKCTCDENVSIPELATLIQERTRSSSWVVICKALITTHHLMNYGSERFIQYLASNNCAYNLDMNPAVTGCDMSVYIRQYANYLNEKAISYRLAGSDFCRLKQRNETVLRKSDHEKLIKEMQFLQNQLDALLQIQMTPDDVDNKVICSLFVLLFKDLASLQSCQLEGVANLLEHYFEMSKKLCREAVNIYKKFIASVEPVCVMVKLAEAGGVDDCQKISSPNMPPFVILEALENQLDVNKKSLMRSSADAEITKFVAALDVDISRLSTIISPSNLTAHLPDVINENNSNATGTPPVLVANDALTYLDQPLSDDHKGYLISMASQNTSSPQSLVFNSSSSSNTSPTATSSIISLDTSDITSCTNPFLATFHSSGTTAKQKVDVTPGNEFVNPSSDLFSLMSTSPATDLSNLTSKCPAANDLFGLHLNGDVADLFGVPSNSQTQNLLSSSGVHVGSTNVASHGINPDSSKSFESFTNNSPTLQWTDASKTFAQQSIQPSCQTSGPVFACDFEKTVLPTSKSQSALIETSNIDLETRLAVLANNLDIRPTSQTNRISSNSSKGGAVFTVGGPANHSMAQHQARGSGTSGVCWTTTSNNSTGPTPQTHSAPAHSLTTPTHSMYNPAHPMNSTPLIASQSVRPATQFLPSVPVQSMYSTPFHSVQSAPHSMYSMQFQTPATQTTQQYRPTYPTPITSNLMQPNLGLFANGQQPAIGQVAPYPGQFSGQYPGQYMRPPVPVLGTTSQMNPQSFGRNPFGDFV